MSEYEDVGGRAALADTVLYGLLTALSVGLLVGHPSPFCAGFLAFCICGFLINLILLAVDA